MPFILASILALLFFATPASALPGVTLWLTQGTSDTEYSVSVGEVAEIQFAAGAGHSTLIGLSGDGDLCFIPDSNSAAGAARIAVYRAVALPVDDDARIVLPSVPFDGTNCLVLVMGRYWFEITTPAGGGENAVVTLTGR